MKKNLALLVAAMLCACCLGLAACGGSSSSSAASGSASASASASESTSASAASDSASASASASSASSDASSEVSAELKEAAEKMVALADEQAAVVEKAKAEGYDAVKAEWDELQKQASEVTDALKPWVDKFTDGSISDAERKYYMKVVVPAASKSAQAGLDMLDLMTQ